MLKARAVSCTSFRRENGPDLRLQVTVDDVFIFPKEVRMKTRIAAGLVIVTAALLGACATSSEGRNWSNVDTNKDGSVSADEMDSWLKSNPGPDAKKQQ